MGKEDLWECFKTLRQTTQTDLANAAFGECTQVRSVHFAFDPSIHPCAVCPFVSRKMQPLCPVRFAKANSH